MSLARCWWGRMFGIATVAVGAGEVHRFCGVHGGLVGGGVAGDAAGGFAMELLRLEIGPAQ